MLCPPKGTGVVVMETYLLLSEDHCVFAGNYMYGTQRLYILVRTTETIGQICLFVKKDDFKFIQDVFTKYCMVTSSEFFKICLNIIT
jgi:hypothetical protein